jgi:hypothetical protein
MTFRQAVTATPQLGADSFNGGLQALEPADRARVRIADTRKISGSVDVDGALEAVFPKAHRWDYAIGYRRQSEIVYWVEVHPASTGDVVTVQAKLTWLRTWLAGDGHRLREIEARFIWISSGKTTFTQGSPTMRKLAQQGLQAVGRVLRIE